MYHEILTKLQTELNNDALVNTVSSSDIFDVDLSKQTIFPLCHIIVNSATFVDNVIQYNISILSMDVVDVSKDETTNKFRGNDNEQDVLNTQLNILNRLYEKLRRGNLYDDNYQVDGTPNLEIFVDRFENKLAGWTATFNILLQNEMTVCS